MRTPSRTWPSNSCTVRLSYQQLGRTMDEITLRRLVDSMLENRAKTLTDSLEAAMAHLKTKEDELWKQARKRAYASSPESEAA